MGCQSAPISGRQQFVIIPEAQEIALGRQAYQQALADEPISENSELVAMVNRVGQRIAAAADKPEYHWEFRVIARDEKNAFALPGGKVAIYEGIIPICQDEAGLAVVMSHEVAHALARHGGERMSQQAAAELGGGILQAVGERKTDPATTEKVMQVYGAASKYGVILPYSRKHESEADAIGLILMAKAGYDPSAAPEFWERFSRVSGSNPPELLSTHPSDARRAADLRSMLPEAMNYYEAAPVQLGLGNPLPPIRQDSITRTTSGRSQQDRPPLAFAPTNSRKTGVGSPPSAPKNVAPDRRGRSQKTIDSSEAFELPVVTGHPASATDDAASDAAESHSLLNDGWRDATGRAVVPLTPP